jgi:hypothetical protein
MDYDGILSITNVEETKNWELHNSIYWVFTFKDRTFEILSPIPKVIERECTIDVVRNHVAEFSSILMDHF